MKTSALQGSLLPGSILVALLFATVCWAAAPFSLRINCGADKPYRDSGGNDWVADQFYRAGMWGAVGGGTVVRAAHEILDTKDAAIYLSEHYDVNAYHIPVPAGRYRVTLHFCETYDGVSGEGQRVFSVLIGKTCVLPRFDPYKEAGKQKFAAVRRSFYVSAPHNEIYLDFEPVDANGPEINGIEVESIDKAPSGFKWIDGTMPPRQQVDAATLTIDTSRKGRLQVIDGFGDMPTAQAADTDYQKLYYDDLGASMLRVFLQPSFIAPYSDFNYYSPWFMGRGVKSVLNIEEGGVNSDGPEGNRVRTYSGPDDYSRPFGGQKAPIAVMGPDIQKNITLFDYAGMEQSAKLAQAGLARKVQLGDFKLFASFLSPQPWVKVSSGNTIGGGNFPMPVKGTAWPFIWGGNFSGGRLDVSGKPLELFNDGTGPTSALTQFVRCASAYIKGFQDKFGVKFYAISIQNELNFEEFYSSATYPLTSQYITTLKAMRKEFDKYPDLKDIKIIGPEDLLTNSQWGMWQIGSGDKIVQKNLQYMRDIEADAEASRALGIYCVHGEASDRGTAAGAQPLLWQWWSNGWQQSVDPHIPAHVQGFRAFGKRSWSTEGHAQGGNWRQPANGFPGNGAWSIADDIQQTLTTGMQSADIYLTLAGNSQNADSTPQFIAAKHFFKYIRPNAVAVKTRISRNAGVTASAFVHDVDNTLTIVLVNRAENGCRTTIKLPKGFKQTKSFQTYTSSEKSLWNPAVVLVKHGVVTLTVPGYGVVTVVGTAGK